MNAVLVTRPRGGDPARLAFYLQALAATGLDAAVVAPGEALPPHAGILLPGGGDIAPARFGQMSAPETQPADEALDELELDLARQALADGTPLLAICRGVQVLNVAAGGDLVQHIEGHRRVHPVWAWGELSSLDGRDVCSSHHQAVGRPGAGLEVLALAPDGVVEAVGAGGHPFCLGVQWHPEREPRHPELFAAFAAAVVSRAGPA